MNSKSLTPSYANFQLQSVSTKRQRDSPTSSILKTPTPIFVSSRSSSVRTRRLKFANGPDSRDSVDDEREQSYDSASSSSTAELANGRKTKYAQVYGEENLVEVALSPVKKMKVSPDSWNAFLEYQKYGDYSNETEKTDYTYSKLSKFRNKEIIPGFRARPNLSRKAITPSGRNSFFSSYSFNSRWSLPETTYSATKTYHSNSFDDGQVSYGVGRSQFGSGEADFQARGSTFGSEGAEFETRRSKRISEQAKFEKGHETGSRVDKRGAGRTKYGAEKNEFVAEGAEFEVRGGDHGAGRASFGSAGVAFESARANFDAGRSSLEAGRTKYDTGLSSEYFIRNEIFDSGRLYQNEAPAMGKQDSNEEFSEKYLTYNQIGGDDYLRRRKSFGGYGIDKASMSNFGRSWDMDETDDYITSTRTEEKSSLFGLRKVSNFASFLFASILCGLASVISKPKDLFSKYILRKKPYPYSYSSYASRTWSPSGAYSYKSYRLGGQGRLANWWYQSFLYAFYSRIVSAISRPFQYIQSKYYQTPRKRRFFWFLIPLLLLLGLCIVLRDLFPNPDAILIFIHKLIASIWSIVRMTFLVSVPWFFMEAVPNFLKSIPEFLSVSVPYFITETAPRSFLWLVAAASGLTLASIWSAVTSPFVYVALFTIDCLIRVYSFTSGYLIMFFSYFCIYVSTAFTSLFGWLASFF